MCAPLATANLASVCAVISAPSKITPEAIITWRKERAQLNAGLKTIREPSSMTPINPACSFNSLAEWSSVDLHVDDTCTKRQPCGASGRMHESDEGHPSNSSSSELTDEVVKTLNNHRRGKRKKKKHLTQQRRLRSGRRIKMSLWQQCWGQERDQGRYGTRHLTFNEQLRR